MSKKWVFVFTMAAMAAMLFGAGSGFAVNTYYWDGGVGGAGTQIDVLTNWSTLPGGGGVDAVPAFAGGDILVFNNVVGGALGLTTSAAIAVGVTLTVTTQTGLVTITPIHNIELSGIDMSGATGAGAALTIAPTAAETVTLSADANFITKTGYALIISHVLANGGHTLTVSGDGTPLFSGGMTGNGGLTLSMAGAQAVTFSGTEAAYTGNTTITKGILTTGAADLLTDSGTYILADDAQAGISTGGAEIIGSLSGSGAGFGAASTVVMGGALTITQATDGTYSGIISSVGTRVLRKEGTGTLKLNGNNVYDGATNVAVGTLLVNGTQGGVGGAYTVSLGATLGGKGTIHDAVTIDGVMKPGDPADPNGVGTFTTTGAFTFSNGSKLIVDILNNTCDLLAVGTALSVGATSEIQLGTVTGAQGILYTVVTAGSGGANFPTNSTGWTQSSAATWIKLLGPAAVPTLNELGIIIMLLLLAGASIILMRRRQRARSIA